MSSAIELITAATRVALCAAKTLSNPVTPPGEETAAQALNRAIVELETVINAYRRANTQPTIQPNYIPVPSVPFYDRFNIPFDTTRVTD